MEFKILFVHINVNPGHNLKRQKGLRARINIKAGGELQWEQAGSSDEGP